MQRAKEMKIMEMRLWRSSQKRSVNWVRNSKLAEKKGAEKGGRGVNWELWEVETEIVGMKKVL